MRGSRRLKLSLATWDLWYVVRLQVADFIEKSCNSFAPKILKSNRSLETTPPPGLPSALISTNSPITAGAGVDLRSLAVLSRIYVGSINFELNETHIKSVFEQFGSIKAVSMTIDPATSKHKGYCFVEFETPEASVLALESMNGAELGGRQMSPFLLSRLYFSPTWSDVPDRILKVGRPHNYTAANLQGLPEAPNTRIYISNVSEHISEENLQSIFDSFGPIKACVLIPDLITRKHKGYG